jgi:hypothetical protein
MRLRGIIVVLLAMAGAMQAQSGRKEWIGSSGQRVKAEIFRSSDASTAPVLVLVLHGRPPYVGVQLRKLRRHLLQDLIHHLADRPQRMIGWYSLLWRNVAEHSFLLVIVSAHSLTPPLPSFFQMSVLT